MLTAQQKTNLASAFVTTEGASGDLSKVVQFLIDLLCRPVEEQRAEMSRWLENVRRKNADLLASADTEAAERKVAINRALETIDSTAAALAVATV